MLFGSYGIAISWLSPVPPSPCGMARPPQALRWPQRRIGDEMGGIGGLRHVAARQFVLALGAGFDARKFMHDGVVDGLIVAQLKMQERMMLNSAPIAAVNRVVA